VQAFFLLLDQFPLVAAAVIRLDPRRGVYPAKQRALDIGTAGTIVVETRAEHLELEGRRELAVPQELTGGQQYETGLLEEALELFHIRDLLARYNFLVAVDIRTEYTFAAETAAPARPSANERIKARTDAVAL
jgi:hypothetical protein